MIKEVTVSIFPMIPQVSMIPQVRVVLLEFLLREKNINNADNY